MFLIYINDLVALFAQYGVKIKLFADDVKLYVKIAVMYSVVLETRVLVSRRLEVSRTKMKVLILVLDHEVLVLVWNIWSWSWS